MEKLTEVLALELNMGGYAAFVWPSFIFAALVMVMMVITSVRSLRKAQQTLTELQQSVAPSPHNET